jgi:hypothetical protein
VKEESEEVKPEDAEVAAITEGVKETTVADAHQHTPKEEDPILSKTLFIVRWCDPFSVVRITGSIILHILLFVLLFFFRCAQDNAGCDYDH